MELSALTLMSITALGLSASSKVAPPVQCEPVHRPPPSNTVPLPPGLQSPPHLVSLLVDDLGYDDTSINGNTDINFTSHIGALVKSGIRLDRHHTYLWCSPTRRAFLSGRYPVHITGDQAPTCSNLLPLQFTTLGEKLRSRDYESHFIVCIPRQGAPWVWFLRFDDSCSTLMSQSHTSRYTTTDHLPANRGFESHVGYLGGGESYRWGGTYGQPHNFSDVKKFDMWSSQGPATNLVAEIKYSTNFYASQAVERIMTRNKSRPFWLHLTMQAVHGGTWRQEVLPQDSVSVSNAYPHFIQGNYGSVTHALDDAIGNITQTLVEAGMWDTTLFLLTSDNGGDCGLPAQPHVGGQPGSASNYPLLGRKCTAFEGGTRVAAFLSGGLIPQAIRGTVSNQLIYITDWYATFCALAGVDSADDWIDPSTNQSHPVDSVNMWPALSAGTDGVKSPQREWLPTTERSLLWNDGNGHMWKLITGGEFQSNRFTKNGTQYMDTFNECLPDAEGAVLKYEALFVPPSCVVCSNSTPCLFDVLADPLETRNVAQDYLSVVTKLSSKLAEFNNLYVPDLSPANMACYNCTSTVQQLWGNFVGPCCVPYK